MTATEKALVQFLARVLVVCVNAGCFYLAWWLVLADWIHGPPMTAGVAFALALIVPSGAARAS